MIRLAFRSALNSAAEQVWDAAVSLEGINYETMPIFRMSAPARIERLTDLQIIPGKPLFRSHIYAFGFIPIDWSDLTLDELTPGRGFIERSTMASMKSWEHSRNIQPDGEGCVLTDCLVFMSRLPAAAMRLVISLAFRNRHRKLRKRFGHRKES